MVTNFEPSRLIGHTARSDEGDKDTGVSLTANDVEAKTLSTGSEKMYCTLWLRLQGVWGREGGREGGRERGRGKRREGKDTRKGKSRLLL